MSVSFSNLKTPFRRINPHPGLMIDVDVWRDAHDYHRDQLGLHHLALHGWGIIQGLEVSIVDGADNTLRIEPGYGIDPAGRFVIVSRSQTYQITAREKQAVFLILQFRDVLAEPAGSVPTRVVEAYRIQERDRLPEEPFIELARLDFDPRSGSVKAPRDANKPGRNELDLLSRRRVGGEAPVHASTSQGADGSLMPRIELLGGQLSALADQVSTLAADVATARAIAPTLEPGDGQDAARLDSLAAQIQHLTGRLESLGVSQPTPEHAQEPGQVQPGLNIDQVSSLVAQQLGAIAQRVDSAEYQAEALAQQIGAARQREESDAQALGARVDGLRAEIDALGLQVQAVLHQVDALPALRSAPPPFEPQSVATTRAPEQSILRVATAEHSTPGWDAHRDGLRYLARELSAMTAVSGQVLNPVRVRDAVGIELLYLSGHAALSLDDGEVDAIGRLLDSGAVVVGEGCATGPNSEGGAREFAMSFVDLANRLGRQLTRVDRGHPLMVARHVFGELPVGARATARVLESGGMVYSDADYGCAWQGGPADRPLARGVIRDALEFGMNLAVFRRNGSH